MQMTQGIILYLEWQGLNSKIITASWNKSKGRKLAEKFHEIITNCLPALL